MHKPNIIIGCLWYMSSYTIACQQIKIQDSQYTIASFYRYLCIDHIQSSPKDASLVWTLPPTPS